jgi:hypothetical protein
MKSSTTLRSLALNLSFCTPPQIDYFPLDLFPNLKELEIDDIYSSSLFQYLRTSVLRLEIVKFTITTLDALHPFVPAIESPSFRSLKQCGVCLDIELEAELIERMEDSELSPAWHPVVAAMTRLPDLEAVDFDAPLQTAWSIYFEQCHHLRVLSWAINPYDVLPSGDLKEVRSAFASALKHIHPSPRVVIIDRIHGEISGSDDSWSKTRPQEWNWGHYL